MIEKELNEHNNFVDDLKKTSDIKKKSMKNFVLENSDELLSEIEKKHKKKSIFYYILKMVGLK